MAGTSWWLRSSGYPLVKCCGWPGDDRMDECAVRFPPEPADDEDVVPRDER